MIPRAGSCRRSGGIPLRTSGMLGGWGARGARVVYCRRLARRLGPLSRTRGCDRSSGSHRTILLSVISLLNEPNTFSPANVDASVMYRKWKESKGKDREYTDIIR